MAPRSLAMASRRRAFSVSMLSNCWLSAGQLLVGLQVDAAEPLAIGLEARRAVRSTSASGGQRRRPAASSASARQSSGAHAERLADLRAAVLGARVARALEPGLDAGARLARVGDGAPAPRAAPAPPARSAVSAAASASAAAWRSLLGVGQRAHAASGAARRSWPAGRRGLSSSRCGLGEARLQGVAICCSAPARARRPALALGADGRRALGAGAALALERR